MKRIKKIVSAAMACFILFTSAPELKAADMAEKPYLGIDPSTVINSDAKQITVPGIETYGTGGTIQMEGSKKGLQGTEWMSAEDAAELGVKHVLLNLGITQLLTYGDTEYQYNGKTYLMSPKYLERYQKTVRELNAQGITVTVVLLVQDDKGLKEWEDLVYHPERGHNFYALNTKTEKARDTWSAVFEYLAKAFGESDCYIENWILGNEVNMPAYYNWTGTLSPAINAKVCADSFVLMYNALQAQNAANPEKPAAKSYISFDRSWCNKNANTGLGAKDFLDRFAEEIEYIQPGVEWCIAFHPYAPIMDYGNINVSTNEKLIWGNNKHTPDNINADFITAANLHVLTDYVKNTYGEQHRIILSEQGFDAKGGQDIQAASLAYTFYAGQFNDMVDAVIFRAWKDHPEEMGLQLGISGRKAHSVFKYMDTDGYAGATGQCVRTIGIKNWKTLVPGFSMNGMTYQDVSPDDWFYNDVKVVSQAGIMTGLNEELFGAADRLGRGQFATIIYRMDGSPAQGYVPKFADVSDGQFYSIPVSWANANGIITGYGHNQLFGTLDDITREQMATVMYRYANYKGRDTSGRADLSGFRDRGNVSGFAKEAMEWIVNEQIIMGEGNTGLLNPQGKVSRAVCATIIRRYMGL